MAASAPRVSVVEGRLPHPLLVILLTVVVFLIADEGRVFLLNTFGVGPREFSGILDRLLWIYSWYIVPPILLALVLFGGRGFSALGLAAHLPLGFAVGFIGTLPMLIGYGFFGTFTWPEDPVLSVMRQAVAPGVCEEILYRGLLFGLVFRFGGVGFIPAALLGSLFFGAAHLYQGGDPVEALAIFAVTAIGAAWFAWLYVEWSYNLWVPITFHMLMNAYWMLFAVGDTALGGTTANIFRLGTIVLSIVLTVIIAKRRGGLLVTRQRLFFNRERG